MASLSPTPIPNQQLQPTTSFDSDRARRKRKKKPRPQPPVSPSTSRPSLQKWRSEKQQQIYSTKLGQALRNLRISQRSNSYSVSSSTPRGGRAVREAADGALAVAARGRTLWSRAILANRSVKLKFRKQKKRPRIPSSLKASVGAEPGNSWSLKQKRRKILRLKKKSLPAVQRKVKVLGRLVPGCLKQSLPVILEETADYIAAKQMQIRAMTAILSAVSPTTTVSITGAAAAAAADSS